MKKSEFKELLYYFLGWRAVLLVIVIFAVKYVPLQVNYLGGGFTNYINHPHVWAWANFDGEHYLSIAQNGYLPLSYFFFPLYPLLIKFFAAFSTKSLLSYLFSGIFVSMVSFFIALIGLWKLTLMDYKKEVARLVVFSLLLFPTSFFFGSVYTESLFLALVVWSFYFARKGNFWMAGILGAFSTATRIAGVALAPAILVEGYLQNKKRLGKKIIFPLVSSVLVLAGVVCYMVFLKTETGDYLAFFHNLNNVFGQQRSATLVLLPQVFYRYIFKILPSVSLSYFPSFFTTWLEFFIGSAFFILALLSFFKQRLSYAIYSVFAYLIPTFSGSFSSFPRYALIIFPLFILMGKLLDKFRKGGKILVFVIRFLLLSVAASLFVRGYWLS